MNGFQIGSKRLKVQHKRTGYDEDPPGNYGMGGDHHSSGGGNAGMMNRGGIDRMHGSSNGPQGHGHGQGQNQGQGQGRPQNYMQQQNQRDNYMSNDQSSGDGNGNGGRFQMTPYGQMQQMNQMAYMPVQLSGGAQDQQHYNQSSTHHRSLQQSLPSHFLDSVEREVDTQYNT